jgi:hypothetical protein
MVHLLRKVPEVTALLHGIRKAARLVSFTLVLELLLVYAFAIIFHTSISDATLKKEYFASLQLTMVTLLVRGVFLDTPGSVIWHPGMDVLLGVLFVIFIFLGCFLLLNVLVGTICTVIAEVSREQKEEADVEFLANSVMDIVECYADPGDLRIRAKDVELMMLNPEVRLSLDRFGVVAEGVLVAFTSSLGEGSDSCSTDDFLNLLLELRRSNLTTVADIMRLRTFMLQRLQLQRPANPNDQPDDHHATRSVSKISAESYPGGALSEGEDPAFNN